MNAFVLLSCNIPIVQTNNKVGILMHVTCTTITQEQGIDETTYVRCGAN